MAILILTYEPIATFELRPSNTTKTGGKTLLCPTPYAIKMAFLDRMIRNNGIVYGESKFSDIRDLTIYLRPPAQVAVNRTFQKILRPPKSAKKDPGWIETIAMREFCIQAGTLKLALMTAIDDLAWERELIETATAINYFGQKGSFYQLVDYQMNPESLDGFVNLSEEVQGMTLGFLQRMDDMQADATFADVNVFQKSSGGRKSYNVVLPYRLHHNGFNHTVWRLEEDQ